jgi:hypothetical protein
MQQRTDEGMGQLSDVRIPESTLGTTPGVMGGILQQADEQWVANRDEHGIWRVLDQWSSTLTNLSPDDDVPDDDPAVTVFTEGAFLAIIRAAIQVGAVPQFSREPTPPGELDADSLQQILELEENNRELAGQSERQYSEIIKLTEDLNTLKNDNATQIEHSLRVQSEAKPAFSESTELKQRAMSLIANLAVTADLTNLAKE